MSDYKQFFSETAETGSLAETLAKEAFVATHPDVRLARPHLRAEEQARWIVLVQYGPVASPQYACYAVDKSTRAVTELVDAREYLPKR